MKENSDLMINSIKKRYLTTLKSTMTNDSVNKYLSELSEDGSWKDINYSGIITSFWEAQEHILRLFDIACAIYKDKKYANKSINKQKVLSALNYWLSNDFINSNWWHNEIGTPSKIADICILLYDDLTEEEKQSAYRIIERGSISHNKRIYEWTGANLIWGVWTSIKLALLTRDIELIKKASQRAAKEIYVAEGPHEGIKQDRSFFQHGPLLYSNGYGRSFMGDCVHMAFIFSGSPIQFSKEQLELLAEMMVKGTRFMIRRNTVDFISTGRQIARKGDTSADSYRNLLELMLKTKEMPYKEELNQFYMSFDDDSYSLCESKYFYSSEIFCHHRKDFYVSVKTVSNRIFGHESINNENFLGYNLSNGGSMCIMRDGNEYTDIFPCWDWSLIPGTTCIKETHEELLAKKSWSNKPGTSTLCGGNSFEYKGFIYTNIEHDELSGVKSWFFFDDAVIALGAGISYGGNRNVTTSINQCLKNNSEVIINSKPYESNTEITGDCCIYHRGIGYIAYRKDYTGKISLNFSTKTKSWTEINLAQNMMEIDKEILTLYIDHGINPEKAFYAYTILPSFDKEKSLKYLTEPKYVILSNTDQLQAVSTIDLSMIFCIFYQPGELLLPDGRIISSAIGGMFVYKN